MIAIYRLPVCLHKATTALGQRKTLLRLLILQEFYCWYHYAKVQNSVKLVHSVMIRKSLLGGHAKLSVT